MNANRKFAVPLEDGLIVESVYYGTGTLCVSSQAGCSAGCPFCASGSMGLFRNLTVAELSLQLDTAIAEGLPPRRITVSGIGEPLHNPSAVRSFIDHAYERGIPVSLTTTGYPLPRLREFLTNRHNGLMISLHAGTSKTRQRLLPHAPNLRSLWSLLTDVMPILSRRQRRKTGINYLLLQGMNDSYEELAPLIKRLRSFPDMTLHLLVCNPVPGSPFQSPSQHRIEEIADFFRRGGITNVRLPNRWRIQPQGGCGTLFARHARHMNLGSVDENMLGL